MNRVRKDYPLGEELWRDSAASAKAIGLRFVHDGLPGICRRRRGKGFMYLDPKGLPLRDPRVLKRVRSLVIPPAWREVWICPSPSGHVQATGRDDRGRKQYVYHPAWAEFRNEVKFARLLQFASALPLLRRQVETDLRRRSLSREKILATVVRLLEKSLIRVGNEIYQRENNSFGLTTLQRHHVEVETSVIRFAFRGKSGKWHERSVQDRRVAKVLKQLLDLPGQELFRYINGDGELRAIASEDVNRYLQRATGATFTAKDMRTWHATVCAAAALRAIGPAETATQEKMNIALAVREVAGILGNRPAASRKYYIHPEILESYRDGTLLPTLDAIIPSIDHRFPPELDGLETAVKIFLELRQKKAQTGQEMACPLQN